MEEEENVVSYLGDQTEPTVTWLRGKFPFAGAEAVEDAVQDALLHALENPNAYKPGSAGDRVDARRLFRTVAWRALRGQLRRKGNRTIQLNELDGAAPSQLDLVLAQELQELVQASLPSVLAKFGEAKRSSLQQAFVEKLRWLDGDAALARRYGVRREYLGAIRRQVGELIKRQGSAE